MEIENSCIILLLIFLWMCVCVCGGWWWWGSHLGLTAFRKTKWNHPLLSVTPSKSKFILKMKLSYMYMLHDIADGWQYNHKMHNDACMCLFQPCFCLFIKAPNSISLDNRVFPGYWLVVINGPLRSVSVTHSTLFVYPRMPTISASESIRNYLFSHTHRGIYKTVQGVPFDNI